MIQIFINRDFLYNLFKLPFDEQQYIYSFLKKIVSFELFVDIKREDLVTIEKEFPQSELLFCEQATIKYTGVSINTDFIENKALIVNVYYAKLFFLELELNQLKYFSEKYGYLFCNTKMTVSHLEEYFYKPIDKWNQHELAFNRRLLRAQHKFPIFATWSDIACRTTSSCFFLINDRYCLIDFKNQSVKNNIAQLLASILVTLPPKIFATFIISAEKKNTKSEAYFENYLTNILNVEFKSRFILKVLFIDKYSSFHKDNHPRIIASNSTYIESNNSFNYFNDDNTLNSSNFLIHYKNILTSYPTCMVLKQFYTGIINYIKSKNLKGIEMLLK